MNLEKTTIERIKKIHYDQVKPLVFKTKTEPFFPLDAAYFDKDTFYHLINRMASDQTMVTYVVKVGQKIVGLASLRGIDDADKSCEYTIYVEKAYQGKGVAKTATDLILNEAFHRLGLNSVYLRVEPFNKKAQHFYDVYGFKKTECTEYETKPCLYQWYKIGRVDR